VERGAAQPNQRFFKKNHFVDTTISIILRDLPFSQNQPLKTADDYYIAT
jgi:hypothetical protein